METIDKEQALKQEAIFMRCVQEMQIKLVEAVEGSLNNEMSSHDQMGACVMSITTLIMDLTRVIANGTAEQFTFEQFIELLKGMKKMMDGIDVERGI